MEDMAQQALGPGTALPRKRAMFGLLDADGWGWASVKAFVWLIFIILILGYLPDRAYYFTVGRTVDLGVLVWSPINLCPPTNLSLPCPAPAGAIIPWETSPPELSLPAGRTDGMAVQVGSQILYIGGSDGSKATATTYVATTVETGNFDKWAEGPALPAPRANSAAFFIAGSLYVIGGTDDTGAPTDTVFVLSPDPQTGQLGEWKTADNLKLPEARTQASTVVTPDGVLLIGGRNANGLVDTTFKTLLSSDGKLGAWSKEAPLVSPQADGTAVLVGNYVWYYGGVDANGPTATVQRGEFGQPAAAGLPANPDQGKLVRWGVNTTANLPAPRANASGWGANGAIYVAGGADASGQKTQIYWAIPDNGGNIAEWKYLQANDLPTGIEGAPAVINGSNVVLIGGTTSSGVVATSVRANTAPQSPFFQLGLAGATIPGMKIEGEIGQQLGYLNAAGVGTVDFIILILIGIAFAHKERTRQILGHWFRRFRDTM
jgi:N-acetylneuraminic acid mutarotase